MSQQNAFDAYLQGYFNFIQKQSTPLTDSFKTPLGEITLKNQKKYQVYKVDEKVGQDIRSTKYCIDLNGVLICNENYNTLLAIINSINT